MRKFLCSIRIRIHINECLHDRLPSPSRRPIRQWGYANVQRRVDIQLILGVV